MKRRWANTLRSREFWEGFYDGVGYGLIITTTSLLLINLTILIARWINHP